MLDLKISLAIFILTFVLFAGGSQFIAPTISNASTNATATAIAEAQDILGEKMTANATGQLMTQAENVLNLTSDAASNATQTAMNTAMNLLSNASSNVSDTMSDASTDETELDDEFDDNSGVGYYDPPYSYTQCLTVFTKEMCDFRFNSD